MFLYVKPFLALARLISMDVRTGREGMEDRDECASAAIRGDEEALLRRIDMDKRQLYGIAFAYMRNEEDALEAIQETVCRVWAKRRTLREAKYFTTWTIRILIRVCMDEKKKRKREQQQSTIDASRMQRTIEANDEEEDAAARLDMAAQVQALPAKYRMVVVLKYYRDMTIMEIAELLEKPDGSIRTWLNKALKLLRSDMTKTGEVEAYVRGIGKREAAGRGDAAD
ncbi:sigma-70 family RNA polymerase sigma factor [Paenibacillus harenae]|uniref:RNA polymerase sigma-70 factor (ECF subfamily) n=1 Tax=Paenibacillus harenae TaxID=306543 RepID=A0ABT9U8L5_PAEHA|nr:sigma-70 family RNA polymerase sigma factor [Paenibacillus harenae]MDQ0115923.1 RNA polymerase sigma-70 factor (ECF subfamily) [Paenibacillus harenae]